jgi:large subunit ribosomal protein L4
MWTSQPGSCIGRREPVKRESVVLEVVHVSLHHPESRLVPVLTSKAYAGRGGGTIHGPHPRDFALSLPRKVQHLGLHVALSSKLQTGLLRVVKDYGEAAWTGTRTASLGLSDETLAAFNARKESSKGMLEETPEAAEPTLNATEATVPSLEKFGPAGDLSITFVHGPAADITTLERIDRCVRNIPGIDVLPVEDLAAYEVLRRKWTVLDVSAVEWLGTRAGQAQLLESEEGAEAEADDVRFEEVPVSETNASSPAV